MKEDKVLRGLLFIFVLFLSTHLISAEEMVAGQTCSDDASDYHDSIVLFYSYTCPHCHEEIKFLNEEVMKVYPDLDLHMFETAREENGKNRELFKSFAERFNSSMSGVPRTFINGKVFVGFDPGRGDLEYVPTYKAYIGYKNQLINEIKAYAKRNNIEAQVFLEGWGDFEEDKVFITNEWLIFFLILLYLPTYFIFRKKINKSDQNKRYWISGLIFTFILSFFLFIVSLPESIISGFAQKLPFGLFVTVVSLADGFNPCAFTVLFILLSLLTYTKVKKTMFHIGNAFIITSAVMYFLFIMIMVWIGAAFIGKYGDMILQILGVIILIAGAINIKDFFFFNKGVSLTISDKEKSKISQRARRIVQKLNESRSKKTFLIALGSTIALAIGVNLVELGCSAILPLVYMSALTGKYGLVIGTPHILWTLLYSFIYVIPLYAILMNFIFTFRSNRITEKQGRTLKLVAGIFMFLFGIIMVLNPTLLMMG